MVARVLVDEAPVGVLLPSVVVVKVARWLAGVDRVLVRVGAVVRRLDADVLGADAVAAGKVAEAVEVGVELVDGARVDAAVGLRERLGGRAEAGLAGKLAEVARVDRQVVAAVAALTVAGRLGHVFKVVRSKGLQVDGQSMEPANLRSRQSSRRVSLVVGVM